MDKYSRKLWFSFKKIEKKLTDSDKNSNLNEKLDLILKNQKQLEDRLRMLQNKIKNNQIQ